MAFDEQQSAAAFAPLDEKLSQGDIVQGVPWAVLEHPLTVCRPDGGRPGVAHYAEPKDCMRQAAFSRGPELVHALCREQGLGAVIWEDCQIDKMRHQQRDEQRWFVAVAPVVPFTAVQEEESRSAIREGRHKAFFPLPALPALEIPESYIDLRLIWPVRQAMLRERLTTLSSASRAAFYGHLLRFFTGRNFADEITCPTCQMVISAEHFLVPDDASGE